MCCRWGNLEFDEGLEEHVAVVQARPVRALRGREPPRVDRRRERVDARRRPVLLGAPREAFSYKMSGQEVVLVEAVLVQPRPLGRERRTKAERPPSYCIVLPEAVDGLRDGPGQFVVHFRQVGQPHGEKNAPPELLHREVVQIVS